LIYLIHGYPPEKLLKHTLIILYTFADPVDVVLSLLRLYDERGEKWMKQHYDHLKVPYTNFENIIEEDQLELENHLNTWLQERRFPIAFVKYEELWEHQDEISEFLGLTVSLPPFRERKANKQNDQELISQLKQSYEPLRNKINDLNGFFIHQ